MARGVVITGVGLVTPLGRSPGEILDRIGRGEVVASTPPFDPSAFACPRFAPIDDFDAEQYFPENKTLRLMNRDAQLAVVAARLAMHDAALVAGETYPSEAIALYGATGLAGMPIEELDRPIRFAAGPDGSLDLKRFGVVALKRTRPVLSFKILANMPICFVSIFESICGPNAVYTPWEGQGAQAIAAGVRAVRRGDVPVALVGGCDVKTRLMSFVALEQLGAFDSWRQHGTGCVPGEGAAFLVIEEERQAVARSARIYARIDRFAIRSRRPGETPGKAFSTMLSGLDAGGAGTVVASSNGDPGVCDAEGEALAQAGLDPQLVIRPKSHLGDLFAAAAAVQLGLGAELALHNGSSRKVLANCCGFGSQQAAFALEAP